MNKAKITGSAQIFLVKDVHAAADYYRDKMGFDCTLLGEPIEFCIAGRDNHHLMLSQSSDSENVSANKKVIADMWDAYFWVDNIEALYVEMDQRGVMIDYGLKLANYGVKEFGVKDIDGYEIAFGQIIK
ncbi:MAG: bleomycin resistance protein [Gammaproteobacteria bacterium]|nr:bleomycin resistance protein [Gammaproteobacteria bacterium]